MLSCLEEFHHLVTKNYLDFFCNQIIQKDSLREKNEQEDVEVALLTERGLQER